MAPCEHLAQAPTPDPPAESICGACFEHGERWVSLRQCLTCGEVGCCDSSGGRHANAHYESTGHPTVRSIEPGERWSFCFVHRTIG